MCSCLCISSIFRTTPRRKVSSPQITLETQVQSIQTTLGKVETKQEDIAVTQKQLQKTATTLTKMILVVEDRVGQLGDTRPQRDKLLQKYTKEIQSLIPKEYSKDLNRDIDSLYKTP
jgi:septal ring factor EnvC (AmiA/AmiB activator)